MPASRSGGRASRTDRGFLAAAAVAAALLAAAAAVAHPLAPALLELREVASGHYEVQFKISALQAPGSEPAPLLPERCRAAGPPAASLDGDVLVRRWRAACGDLVGQRVGIDGLGAAGVDGLVRITFADGRVVQDVVRGAIPAFVVPAPQTRPQILARYARLGAAAMLGALDHVFFLAGLLLLARTRRLMVETVGAFLVGSSLTLSSAAFGAAPGSPPAIALAIAFSVFWLAVELAREQPPRPTLVQRRPYLVAGGFGLVHGLGFAADLHAIGLPSGEVPAAAVAFNAGVALGQLGIVAGWLAIAGAVRQLPLAVTRRLAPLPLYAMGSLAALWCFERAAALLR